MQFRRLGNAGLLVSDLCLDLTPDEVAALDTASALPELYPYVMIDTYGQRTL
ncbi:MAG: hypothetical protein AAGG50_04255 [Bacteroidota bacterium]